MSNEMAIMDYTVTNINHRPMNNGTQAQQLTTAQNQFMEQNMYNDPTTAQNNYYSNSYYGWTTPTANSNYNYNNGVAQPQMVQTYTSSSTYPNNSASYNPNNSTSSVEDSLEFEIREKIKVIHKSYQHYLSTLVNLLKDELNSNFSNYNRQMNYQMYYQPNGIDMKSVYEVLDHLRIYQRKVTSFMKNIPGS